MTCTHSPERPKIGCCDPWGVGSDVAWCCDPSCPAPATTSIHERAPGASYEDCTHACADHVPALAATFVDPWLAPLFPE